MSLAQERDRTFMQLALRVAERGLGTTAPNPSVGAVLVRFDGDPQGIVVARGCTQPGGRPHAETEALKAAGDAARGATLYVTLEPCSHHGKTPPCAEAVIAAGVSRVVVGIEDPDARVAGRGIAMLRAAGTEVAEGIEAAACRRLTLGHILRVTEQRPMVLVKMALSDDLSIPEGGGGTPSFATGPEARAAGHLLRAQSDAILVGAGTVRDDDPELTCRLPGMAHRSPIRVVLDGKLDAVTPATKLAQSARGVPVWVFTGAEAPHGRRSALEDLGVRVTVLEAVNCRPDPLAVLRALANDGITRLMLEGGREVWKSFDSRRCIDEAVVFVSAGPRLRSSFGWDTARGPLPFKQFARFSTQPDLTCVQQGPIGIDHFVRFERNLRGEV